MLVGLLAPGNLHDVTMAPDLLSLTGPLARLIADKAYDTNAFRRGIIRLDRGCQFSYGDFSKAGSSKWPSRKTPRAGFSQGFPR